MEQAQNDSTMVVSFFRVLTGRNSQKLGRDSFLGLPVNLWSQTTFKRVSDMCGGWIGTEEQTKLKNHLHSARIKVKGDGRAVPQEIRVGM